MSRLLLLTCLLLLASSAAASQASRYQPLLTTPAGRDTLFKLAAWEDGRVTGDGKLFEYLRSKNPLVRLRAVETIGRIQDPADAAYLVPLIADPDPRVAREAVFALGQLGSSTALRALIEAAAKSSPEMMPTFAEAIGKIGSGEAVGSLVEMLRAFQGPVRAGAALGLSRIDDDSATSPLLVAIHDGDPKVSWRAIYALEKRSSKRVRDAVTPFLRNEDPMVRAYAARTLGKQKATDAVADLEAAMFDPDIRVSINAINALAAILEGTKKGDVVGKLGSVIARTSSPHVRKAAVTAIGSIGSKDGKDALAQTVLDVDPGVRGESYRSMAKTLRGASYAFVKTGMTDSSVYVRAAAVEALGLAGDDKRIPDLVAIAQESDDRFLRAAAVRALSNFKSDEAVTVLISRLSDPDWVVATEAVTSLGKIGDKRCIPPIVGRFSVRNDHVDADIRIEIMRVLGEMRAAEGRPIAVEALDDGDPRLRRAALEYFDKLKLEKPEVKSDRYFYARDFNPSRKAQLALPMGTRRAVLTTPRGEVEIELFGDDAIQTVANFIRLSRSGFYNDGVFHRVVPNFVVQGGCPRGDGWGDDGYYIRSEVNQYTYERGLLGIADSGKDTGGTQFFITHSPQPHLNGRYTIFGRVTKGMDVVDRIAQGDRFKVAIVDEP